MNRTMKYIKSLTDDILWQQYVTDSVEIFLSNFKEEGYELTDIKSMCQKYAEDIFDSFETLYSAEQVNYLAERLEQYINNYIEQQGGIQNLKLFNKEELEQIWEKECNGLMNILKWKRFV
jgi:hypothetical protein